MPLTDVKCRNAKRKIKPHKLSDGGGLHLLVNADGAKYWRLAYRWHGKQRTLALGVYPAVGLVEARAARDDVKRNLAAGLDPSMVKRERKRAAKVAAGNSLEAVAREWHENWERRLNALLRRPNPPASGGGRLPSDWSASDRRHRSTRSCSICCGKLRSAGCTKRTTVKAARRTDISFRNRDGASERRSVG